MKYFSLIAAFTVIAISNFAKADVLDSIAEKSAIAEVQRQVYIHQSNLNENNSKMLGHFQDGDGAPTAVVMSRLSSKSEVDSTVLVRIPYSTISAVSEMGSMIVKVKVTSLIDDNTSKVTSTKAVVDSKSIELFTELPLD